MREDWKVTRKRGKEEEKEEEEEEKVRGNKKEEISRGRGREVSSLPQT